MDEPLLAEVRFTEAADDAVLGLRDGKATQRIKRKVEKDIEKKPLQHLRNAEILKDFIEIDDLAELVIGSFRLLGYLEPIRGIFIVVDVQRKKGDKLPGHVLKRVFNLIQPYL